RHVLLAAHDSDRFGRSERHFLGGPGQRLPQPDLVVDSDAGVATLDPVHPDHAAVRVFGIPPANPGGGGLRALDEDDVPFLQFEDFHDLGGDAHDPAAASAGFASATRRHFSRPAAMFSVPPFARPRERRSRDLARNRRYVNSWGKTP